MMADYWRSNQVRTPLATLYQCGFLPLADEQISWCTALDLSNAFYFVPMHKVNWKPIAFSWQSQQYIFTILHGHTKSVALCHKLVHRDTGCISLLQGFTSIHYIDEIMLIKPSNQEEATTLVLVKYLHAKDGK